MGTTVLCILVAACITGFVYEDKIIKWEDRVFKGHKFSLIIRRDNKEWFEWESGSLIRVLREKIRFLNMDKIESAIVIKRVNR